MRALLCLVGCLMFHGVSAETLSEATTARQETERQLETLRNNKTLGEKRVALIEAEIETLATRQSRLKTALGEATERLNGTRAQVDQTATAMRAQEDLLNRLIERYQDTLVTYYISGHALDPSPHTPMMDYLPFVLQQRQRQAEFIAVEYSTLEGLKAAQTEALKAESEALATLQASEKALENAKQDQVQLLATASRSLDTQASREAALKADLDTLNQRIKRLSEAARQTNLIAQRGRLQWPIEGPVIRNFGQLRDDGFGAWQGLVIGTDRATEVRAVQAGEVAYAGYLLGYGLVVVLAHDRGHATIYGHNARLLVDTGDTVETREVIAITGNTGSLEQRGLYFALTHNGQPMNPGPWLN